MRLKRARMIKPKTAQDYMRRPYARVLVPEEGGGFSARILEFPGCIAEGETGDEALRALDRAAESWLDVALDLGHTIPEALAEQEYSGKFALRLPRSLHEQVVRVAEMNQTSANQFIAAAIAEKLGQHAATSQILPAVRQIVIESIRQVAESHFARLAMSNAATALNEAVQKLEYSSTSVTATTGTKAGPVLLEERTN
jgi:predicted RNase H-like HicB family nuclease